MKGWTGTPTAWVLTDGKAGDEEPCLALAASLGIAPRVIRVSPRRRFAWAMPWGPADRRELRSLLASEAGLPDLLLASGRRAIPYVRAIRRVSGERTFTVVLKDPRTGAGSADLIWVPSHDRLRGRNVIATSTAPHRVSPERLAEGRQKPDPRLAPLPRPWAAVLVGGSSRHHRYGEADIARFAAELRSLAAEASLAITASRRTPPALRTALAGLVRPGRDFLWDGSGPNPYVSMLAGADAIVATTDSTNMVGEAVATGAPVLLFSPSGGHAKIDGFLTALARHGAVRPFRGHLEAFTYQPLDATAEIAGAVASAIGRHLAGLQPVVGRQPVAGRQPAATGSLRPRP